MNNSCSFVKLCVVHWKCSYKKLGIGLSAGMLCPSLIVIRPHVGCPHLHAYLSSGLCNALVSHPCPRVHICCVGHWCDTVNMHISAFTLLLWYIMLALAFWGGITERCSRNHFIIWWWCSPLPAHIYQWQFILIPAKLGGRHRAMGCCWWSVSVSAPYCGTNRYAVQWTLNQMWDGIWAAFLGQLTLRVNSI